MYTTTIVGVFESSNSATDVLLYLRGEGFEPGALSVVGWFDQNIDSAGSLRSSRSTHQSTSLVTRLQKQIGWIDSPAALTIPTVGSFIVAGPLRDVFDSSSVRETLKGLTDALVSFDVPEYDAMIFEALILEGKILVAINVQDEHERLKASEIVHQFHALNIPTRPKVSCRHGDLASQHM